MPTPVTTQCIRTGRCVHAVVEVFNQTFAVTHILRLIAVLVAVIGIALNLTVLVKEREREIGTLRAVGVSRATDSRTDHLGIAVSGNYGASARGGDRGCSFGGVN